MKKRYLNTVEEVIALKDTDTKIYVERGEGYYQFVDGILCKFDNYNSLIYFNAELDFEGTNYILEEETKQEVTKDDFGKLCWFWHGNSVVFGESEKEAGILDHIEGKDYRTISGFVYANCKRMKPSEVAEVTGYKVEEK